MGLVTRKRANIPTVPLLIIILVVSAIATGIILSGFVHTRVTIHTIGSGSVSLTPTPSTYYYGETFRIKANPSDGWVFTRWSGALTGSANPTTLTVTGNMDVTATFKPNHYTITSSAGSGGNISPSGSLSINYKSRQTFTITANMGYNISDVLVDGVSVGAVSNYTFNNVQSHHAISVNFSNQYSITANTVGQGSVSSNPSQPTYTYGTSVQMTATSAKGWVFAGWEGDISSIDNPIKFKINGNKTVKAVFSEIHADENQHVFSIDPNSISSNTNMMTFKEFFNEQYFSNWQNKITTNNISTPCYNYVIYKQGSLITSREENTSTIINSGYNATTVIQNTIRSIDSRYAAKITIKNGTYIVGTITLSGKSNIKIVGEGKAILHVRSNGVNILYNGGSVEPNIRLINSAQRDNYSVLVPDATTLKTGDWVELVSQDYFNPTYPLQLKGEIHNVKNLIGNNVTFYEPIWDFYDVAKSAAIRKITMIHNIVISNLYFEGTYAGDNCQGITLVDGYDVKISNCTFTNLGACSIWMTNCVYSEVNNCKSSGSNQPGSGYGVAVADASSFVRVHDNEWDNCRHGFTINAASGFGAVRFVDCYENLVNNSTSYGLDAHSTGTYIVFRNNTVKGFTYSGVETYSAGICSGANFTWIEGNNISGGLRDPSYGISYRGAPQEIYIINNTINNLSGASSHGIYLAGNWFLGGCIINNHINSGVCGMSFYTMNPITRFMIYANDIRTSSYGTRFSYSHGFDVIKNNIYGTLKTLEINGSSNIIYGDYDIPAFD